MLFRGPPTLNLSQEESYHPEGGASDEKGSFLKTRHYNVELKSKLFLEDAPFQNSIQLIHL